MNLIDTHRKESWVVILIIWALVLPLVFTGKFPLTSNLSIELRIAVFSTLLGVGIPGLHYLYRTWVLQPEISVDLKYAKTFLTNAGYKCKRCGDRISRWKLASKENKELRKCLNCGSERIEIVNQVIPTLFASLSIANSGEASAKDSVVTFQMEDGKKWYGRWNVPENPERFTLHPHDGRKVHIFRTYIAFSNEYIENDQNRDYILSSPDQFLILETDKPDFRQEDIVIRTQHPRTESPEERGRSSNAGWPGKRIKFPFSGFKLRYVFSAEDWHKEGLLEEVRLRNQLTKEELWQTGWKNKLPGTVSFVEERLKAGLK